jgi:hypothetical protein
MLTHDSIARKAHNIWQVKNRLGIPSTPEGNWEEAKRALGVLYDNEARIRQEIAASQAQIEADEQLVKR